MSLCFMLFYPLFIKSLAKAWGPTKARPKTRMKRPIGPLSQPSECSAHHANLPRQTYLLRLPGRAHQGRPIGTTFVQRGRPTNLEMGPTP